MKRLIFEIAICLWGLSMGYVIGWQLGTDHAYDTIISEECWLTKPELDIACITHIAK